MPKDQDEGFTLVELLTVVLLIAILAAIAMAMLLKHRDLAYRAATKADLGNAVTAQYAFHTEHQQWTTDPSVLIAEGYRVTPDVTPVHVKLDQDQFLACVKHSALSTWLVFDSVTGETSDSTVDCAG